MEVGWLPGSNVTAVARGRGKSLSLDAFQVLGNLLFIADNVSADRRASIAELFGIAPKQRGVDPSALVAGLTCLNVKTIRGIYTSLVDNKWLGQTCMNRSRGGARKALLTMGSQKLAIGSSELQAARPLPARPLPDIGGGDLDEGERDSEEDFLSSSDMEASVAPAGKVHGQLQLDKWREHPHYTCGIRMAQLCTFWITSGLPLSKFTGFVGWANNLVAFGTEQPLGNINQSHHFLLEFASSLSQAVRFSVCAGVHERLLATGLPSDLTRVIDIVTVGGVGLFVLVYIHTNSNGNLTWSVLDCWPVEQHIASRSLAVGSKGGNFRFHGAEQLVAITHKVEAAYRIAKADRMRRLVRTVADGAIAGPGSAQFVKQEALVDGLVHNPLKEGVCSFHAADNAFAVVDRQFPETCNHDCFLRMVKSAFGYGTGRLILKAIAKEFRRLGSIATAKCNDFLAAATKADVEGRHGQAQRCLALAAVQRAEAQAISKAGWDKWRRPLAPQADGTRKVVWQSACRAAIYEQYGLIYWGLRVRMYETRENACLTLQAQGGTPTPKTGMNTKKMQAWRALGRTLIDIDMLVFNCGRSDFRKRHTIAFTLMAQSSLHVGANSTTQAALGASEGMFKSMQALVAMTGIVRMMEQLLQAPQWLVTPNGHDATGKATFGPLVFKNYTLWQVLRTLLAHKCWREFPTLSMRLPELLLAGAFRGVPLHTQEFTEPAVGGEEPLAVSAGRRGMTIEIVRKARILENRRQRFKSTLNALGRLLQWARSERRLLMQRLLGWAPGTQQIFAEADGLPRVNRDLEAASTIFDASGSGQAMGVQQDESEEETHIQEEMRSGHGAGHWQQPQQQEQVEVQEVENDAKCSFAPRKRLKTESVEKMDKADAFVQLALDCADFLPEVPCIAENVTEMNILNEISKRATDNPEDTLADPDMPSDEEEAAAAHLCEGNKPLNELAIGSSSDIVGKPVDKPLPKPWVVKKSVEGGFRFMDDICYKAEMEKQLWRHGDAGAIFNLHIDRVFGPHILASGSPSREEEMSLIALYNEFNGAIWGLPPGSISTTVIKDPPAEVFLPCSTVHFIEEYRHFREWVYGLRRLPFAGEFFKVSGYKVKKAEYEDSRAWIATPADIREAGRWQHFIPRAGTIAHSRRYGQCVIVGVVSDANMTKVYKYIMSTPLHEIRSLGLWRVVASFHRCVHLSRPSESLAETVGSILRFMEQKWNNHPMGVQYIANAAVARMAGLRGLGGEEGILATALNIHFRSRGPEGWHFRQRRRPLAAQGAAVRKAAIQDQVRRDALPRWVDSTLVDLHRAKQIHITKTLPRPLELALNLRPASHDDENAQAIDGSSTSAIRRNAVAAEKLHFAPDKLPDDVFRKLNITVLSLPAHLRPGKYGR